MVFLNYLEKVGTKLYDSQQGFSVASIIVGDIKCSPKSGVYELICEGTIPKFHPDWKSFKEGEKIAIPLQTELAMDSAYGPSQKCTAYRGTSRVCTDYIFYDKQRLEVTKIIPLPTEEGWN